MRVRLVNLVKKFFSLRGTVVAVNNINLEIKSGEFFVLLGPSGSGKSTLLNLIAGLEKPTRGEIFFDDKLVASTERRIFLTPKERNVAFVFQNYALYPHMTVAQNIAFPLEMAGVRKSKIEEAVKQAAMRLKILDLLDARPGELSGGQRQRVAIARAIVRQPNIFLLDEPLSNLDAHLRLSTRVELKHLQRSLGITTVYVTHDQIEAMTLGDRVAVLNEGRLEQVGTPDELYEKPANTFVATFIGSPMMNLLEAELTEEKGNFYIILGNIKIKLPDEKIKSLSKLKTKSCIIGIRPEHVLLVSCGQKAETPPVIKAKIDSIEPLGREMLVHVLFNGYKISLLTNEKAHKEGETINITFDLKKAHIFER